MPYDEKRLLDDQTYNVQLGAAELGDLIKYYRGSYILAFAGYNAGRGRLKEWIAKYPATPKSTRSTGSSEFRSPRPATTCNVCSKTFRSIACAWGVGRNS